MGEGLIEVGEEAAERWLAAFWPIEKGRERYYWFVVFDNWMVSEVPFK